MTSSARRSTVSERAPSSGGLVNRPSNRHDLIAFGVITIVLSWVPWAILGLARIDIGRGPGFIAFGLAAAGPTWAALVMRLAGLRRPVTARLRGSWSWPIAALVFGAAPAVLAAACTDAGDLALLPAHAAATVASVGGPLGALTYTMISGPLSEEFGWRGFLQPRLREHAGRIQTALLLGLAWGVWHLPLFFLPGTGQHGLGIGSLQGALFFVGLFPLSYTFLFLSERLRGGVWAAVAAHAAWNLSEALMPGLNQIGTIMETAMFFAIAGGAAIVWRQADHRSRAM